MQCKSFINPFQTTKGPGQLDRCREVLRQKGLPIRKPDYAAPSENWCESVFDGIMCWPAVQAGKTHVHQCPALPGLDSSKLLNKTCAPMGHWAMDPSKPDAPLHPNGWTDYYVCLYLNQTAMVDTQTVGRYLRIFECIGLFCSFIALIVAITIFISFKRLRVFRNIMHVYLMFAIFIVTSDRLLLYIDMTVTKTYFHNVSLEKRESCFGPTITTSYFICEFFFVILEYAKTVAYAWMTIEGCYLHHMLVVNAFMPRPKMWKLVALAWGWPVIHVAIWLITVVNVDFPYPKCFGLYYYKLSYWVLDGLRLSQLAVNLVFLLNIIRVLYRKAKESNYGQSDMEQTKKSVRGAFMLIPLLGVPNILQMVPFNPNSENIYYWTIYQFISLNFLQLQGLFISMLYCFTNKEVIDTVKVSYARWRMQHSTFDELRRGSRNMATLGRVGSGGSAGNKENSRSQFRQSGQSQNLLSSTPSQAVSPSEQNGHTTPKLYVRSAGDGPECAPLVPTSPKPVSNTNSPRQMSPFQVM